MNADRLLALYDRVADAEDAIPRLRHFVLDLAVPGKLVDQDPTEEPASVLLDRIAQSLSLMVKEGRLNKQKPVQPISGQIRLFQLPMHWAFARFNQVASIESNLVDPGRYRDMPHITPDNIESWTARLLPFSTVGDSGVSSGKHKFRPGSILYSKNPPEPSQGQESRSRRSL